MRRRTRIANSKLLRQVVRDRRKAPRNRDFKLEEQLRRTKRGREQMRHLFGGYSPWKFGPMLAQMKCIARRHHVFLDARVTTPDGKAHAVNSRQMMQLLAGMSGDPHTDTASKMFNVPPREVTAEQRKAGKTANFEFLHGGPPPMVKLDALKSRAPKYYPFHFGEKL